MPGLTFNVLFLGYKVAGQYPRMSHLLFKVPMLNVKKFKTKGNEGCLKTLPNLIFKHGNTLDLRSSDG
jgi:hypothetical protein